jgi:hypothetical protein
MDGCRGMGTGTGTDMERFHCHGKVCMLISAGQRTGLCPYHMSIDD